MTRVADTCQTDGCRAGTARFIIERDDDTRRTCRQCAQEMIALYGWSFVDVVENRPAYTEPRSGVAGSG